MTDTIPWADRFNAYLTDLEAYVATHGHVPAKTSGKPGLWMDTDRLLRMLVSRRTDEPMKDRIKTVLAAPSWRNRPAGLAPRVPAVDVMFAAYLLELEAFVAVHGHAPLAKASATPRIDRVRLVRRLAATEDAILRQRIEALLAARPSPGAGPGKVAMKLASYVAELETYVAVHGHLPSSGLAADLRLDMSRLKYRFAAADTDPGIRERIAVLLAAAPYTLPRPKLTDDQMTTLITEAADLTGLSARQSETLAWIILHRRLPSSGSADRAERTLGAALSATRRAAIAGTARVNTVRFILAVPGFVPEPDRTRIRTLADVRDAARLEAARAKDAATTRLGTLEDRWNKGFAELEDWVATHGALPSRRSKAADEYRVANWINVQRVQFRADNLAPDWVRRLKTVPGALEPRPVTKGDLAFAQNIAAFHAAHGRLPRTDAPAPEGTVGFQMLRLRRKISVGTITAEAQEILSAVPGASDWQKYQRPRVRLAELEAFAAPGSRRPARGDLFQWAHRASSGKASKNPAEAEAIRLRVEELMAGSLRRRYLDMIEAYIRDHGHLPSTGKESPLKFQRQRLRYQLDAPGTDEVTRMRIRAVLDATPWQQRPVRA